MLRSLLVVVRLGFCLFAGSCAGGESGRAQARGAAADSVPATSVTAAQQPASTAQQVQAGTAAVERARSGRPVTVTGVVAGERLESGAPYDRVVFQFADSAAGYRVAYADQPVRRCGSGEPVSLQGTAVLLVRLQPAQAHDVAGRSLLAQREMTPSLRVIKDMKLICDFEGQVEWALGLESRQGFRVSEQSAPSRLVIDVVHPR